MQTAEKVSKCTLRELEPEDLNGLLESKKCLLIDVRESGEYEAERIPDALLYPLLEFDASTVPFAGKRRIVLQCGTGKRSATAAGLANKVGVHEVSHLKGGIKAWKEAGLPVIAYDPATGETRKG